MKKASLILTFLLLIFTSVALAQETTAPPVELTPDLCDNPDNMAQLVPSLMAGEGENPSYGETNIEQAMRMMQNPTEGPFYMVNLIQFSEQAQYADGRETDLTGREANDLYSPTEFLEGIGARPVFLGEVDSNVAGDESTWDQVVIVEYPCPLASFAMSAHPEFQARIIHKDAGLEKSAVMVTHTQPLAEFEVTEIPFPATDDDPAFELVQVFSYHEDAQYAADANEPSRTGQAAMALYHESILEAGLAYGIYPKAQLAVQGVQIGDGRTWDDVWIYHIPSNAALEAFLADPLVSTAQYHREAALADVYELVLDPLLSVVPNLPED